MKVMVIDGNSIVNRAFYGVRPLNNRDGLHTNAIYGFLSILFKLLDDEAPDGVCVAFDLRAPTFRHKMYEGYKAQRKGMPDELAEQMEPLKKVLDAMGILRLECEGHEADDLIGTVSARCAENGDSCVIVTGDRDSFQLIENQGTNVLLVSTRAGRTETTRYGREELFEKYRLAPERMIDLKALMGDSSDNIPGVPGVGEKTALDLVQRFGGIDEIYANLDDLDIRDSVRKKLAEGKENAFLSKALGTIESDAPIDFTPESSVAKPRDDDALSELLTWLEFKVFLAKFKLAPKTADTAKKVKDAGPFEIKCAENDAQVEELTSKLCDGKAVAVCASPELCGVAVCFGKECTVVLRSGISESVFNSFIKKLFSQDVSKICHDCKPMMTRLLAQDMPFGGFEFDTAIAAYVIDPTGRDFELTSCAAKFTPYLPMPDPTPFADDDVFSALTGCDEAISALAACARAVYHMRGEMEDVLKEQGMEKLYREVELPLCRILADMQHRGMLVDEVALNDFGARLGERMAELEELIYRLAGSEFNILSTKQLGGVLFDELGLPPVKKTKTGYSTDIDVLEKLKDKHEIVPAVIEYRQYAKLKSTYTDGLVKVISKKDGRIHSSFNQMITATGRISSTDPNLQNIPVRTELGGEVRKMFVPAPGCVFVDADYSQIELRILAHIADDRTMQRAFLSDMDIHTATAAQVFHVEPEQVTGEMRRAAKAVNFGIVYGISEFSLAEDIGVSRYQAKEYIESYLEQYAGVRMYMKDIVERAHREGFVSTLMGRRRNIPELKAKNFNLRSFGERVALNAPIQGTAADIIKIAMIRVSDELEKQGFRARLVLQVHDELIVEAPREEAQAVAELLTREMQNAYSLSVPLTAEAGIGENWYDAKK